MKHQRTVAVFGAGASGCTFARLLVGAGCSVVLVDAGPQLTVKPGAHLLNEQAGGSMEDFSATVERQIIPLPDPRPSLANWRNDLPGLRYTLAVGGMLTHWTAVCPRPVFESECISPEEWDRILTRSEELLAVTTTLFDQGSSDDVSHELSGLWGDAIASRSAPRAGRRMSPTRVEWSSGHSLLAPALEADGEAELRIIAGHYLHRLVHESGKVQRAIIRETETGVESEIHADCYVVAGGVIFTPAVLWKSDIRPSSLGRYVVDQPSATCQVESKPGLLDERFTASMSGMNEKCPDLVVDSVESSGWYGQIGVQNIWDFGYCSPSDPRSVVLDLVWYTWNGPHADNRLVFSERGPLGPFGSPMPSVEFQSWNNPGERQMMNALVKSAMRLGAFQDEAGPQFRAAGSSHHLTGTTRIGLDEADSVADPWSRVWGFENLYVGGNGVIPNADPMNPTLTTVALAIRSAEAIAAGTE